MKCHFLPKAIAPFYYVLRAESGSKAKELLNNKVAVLDLGKAVLSP
jgi:hypothetical protein